MTGYRPIEGPDGLVLVEDHYEPYEPTRDLIPVALAVADVLEADGSWVTTAISVGAAMPPVWFRDPETSKAVMKRVCGGVMVRATDGSDASSPQMLLANIVETATEEDAALLATGIGSGKAAAAALGEHSATLALVMIARSSEQGVPDKETNHTMQRFAEPLARVLAPSSP